MYNNNDNEKWLLHLTTIAKKLEQIEETLKLETEREEQFATVLKEKNEHRRINAKGN
jgi:hypothetical protein